MRVWHRFMALTLFQAGASVIGCSGETTVIDKTDSGTSAQPPADASSAAATVDFSTYDAGNVAINDAGATTSTCLACANARCPSQTAACGAEVTCSTALTSFLTCAGTGGGAACFTQQTGLLGSGLNASSPIALLSICTFQQCAGPADCAIDTSRLTGAAGVGGTDAASAD